MTLNPSAKDLSNWLFMAERDHLTTVNLSLPAIEHVRAHMYEYEAIVAFLDKVGVPKESTEDDDGKQCALSTYERVRWLHTRLVRPRFEASKKAVDQAEAILNSTEFQHTVEEYQRSLERATLPSPTVVAEGPPKQFEPIPMLLYCPECGARHVDEGEYATKSHHTHACQSCGLAWRPAIVETVGVRFLPGFKNEEPES